MTDEQAAKELGIAYPTAKTQMSNAMRRMQVHSRAQAVAVALCKGWIEC